MVFFATLGIILKSIIRLPKYRKAHQESLVISKKTQWVDACISTIIFFLYMMPLELLLYSVDSIVIFLIMSLLTIFPILSLECTIMLYKDYDKILRSQKFFKKSTKLKLDESDFIKENVLLVISIFISILVHIFFWRPILLGGA